MRALIPWLDAQAGGLGRTPCEAVHRRMPSPILARRLNESGDHEAVHPLDVGRRGERDDQVFARCIAEGRVIVTENARDFRKIVGNVELHCGLILLP